jgi:hypothetical protein
MAANAQTAELLKNNTPEELASALSGILAYITPLIEANPDAKWKSHCPLDTLLGGNYDDAWQEGQDNGEIHAARRIQTLLSKVMEA